MGEDGQAHLKLLMDNIFGRSNFVQTFIWRNTDNADSLGKRVVLALSMYMPMRK
nr:hypothetical protein [Pediococcus inopinatus]